MSDTVEIANLAAEGVGLRLRGRCRDGRWTFWAAGGEMVGSDEHGDPSWQSFGPSEASQLAALLPLWWIYFLPLDVHPEFRAWFRTAYEQRLSEMTPAQRSAYDLEEYWLEMLREG